MHTGGAVKPFHKTFVLVKPNKTIIMGLKTKQGRGIKFKDIPLGNDEDAKTKALGTLDQLLWPSGQRFAFVHEDNTYLIKLLREWDKCDSPHKPKGMVASSAFLCYEYDPKAEDAKRKRDTDERVKRIRMMAKVTERIAFDISFLIPEGKGVMNVTERINKAYLRLEKDNSQNKRTIDQLLERSNNSAAFKVMIKEDQRDLVLVEQMKFFGVLTRKNQVYYYGTERLGTTTPDIIGAINDKPEIRKLAINLVDTKVKEVLSQIEA
jgi:hypothetical protein